MKEYVTQLKIDIKYTDYEEIKAFYEAIRKLNENNEFNIEIVDGGDAPFTEDVTTIYEGLGVINVDKEGQRVANKAR